MAIVQLLSLLQNEYGSNTTGSGTLGDTNLGILDLPFSGFTPVRLYLWCLLTGNRFFCCVMHLSVVNHNLSAVYRILAGTNSPFIFGLGESGSPFCFLYQP